MSASISIASTAGTSSGIHQRFGASLQLRTRLSFPAKSAVCKAISSSVPAIRSPPNVSENGTAKLEYWMRESVSEIVKSLGCGSSSPLIVRVYGGDSAVRIRTERADASDWGRIRGRWRSGEETPPEGIMLVEELKDEEEESGLVKLEEVKGQNGESTKAWGVVLMGRGEEGGVASFLLKTTRVAGGCFGNCVHFSLVKVKSFRETARSQLDNFWLVQAQPSGQTSVETEEFNLLRNMVEAATEERYQDAAKYRNELTRLRAKRNWA